jgi:GH18 family chitinase
MNYRALRWTLTVNTLLLATFLTSCNAENLGFYWYPQASATGISEISSQEPLGGLEVVGYLPAWKIDSVEPSQVRHLTDLVYFSFAALPNGELATRGMLPSHLDFLLKVKREYGIRLVLGITDHKRNGPLSRIVASSALRGNFAKALTQYMKDKGFEGADFDWEYPADAQMADFEALLRDVKAEFALEGFRLSVALSPSHPLTPAGYEAVDRVHGMMYDDEGKHSTMTKIVDHVEAMIREGVEPAKLQLGIPFYGRGYTRGGPKWSNAVSYRDIQERYSPQPSQDVVSGYYFNGIETIRQKVRYAKAAGLSGIMVWEIGQDTTDASSLLAAISETRQGLSKLN